jgi:acyl-CoA reductase-like NAD-dependent aldehyde dehydrogenase
MSLQTLGDYDHGRWQAVAKSARSRIETRLFIEGRYVDAARGGRFATTNPANGETLAEMAAGGADDVDKAVTAAKRAFKSGVWSRMAPRQRMDVLYRFAALIEQNSESLAVLETLDMGKPIADVVSGDLPAVLDTIRFMAECIDKVEGSVTNTEAGVMHMVLREPLGVVGAISPWNYPLLMAVWKIAPALAAGNTVVLKPAEQAPMSCLKLAELFVEAGGPPGVLNVVNGLGEIAGKALALHPDVAKISFTGSTEVGKLILQYAGQSNMKHVGLECGGKSPQVFLADVADLDRAVTAAFRGIYSNMGEVCNAGSRLLVDRSLHERFVQRFIELGKVAYRPAGHPRIPAARARAHRDGAQGGCEARIRRRRAAGAGRGRVRVPHALHRRAQRHDHRAPGDLRPRGLRHPFRRRRRGARHRQRHHLRPRRWRVDSRHRRGVQARARHRGGGHLGQLLRRGRHDAALRRVQAIRERPRQMPGQLQELHAAEVGVVQAFLSGSAPMRGHTGRAR